MNKVEDFLDLFDPRNEHVLSRPCNLPDDLRSSYRQCRCKSQDFCHLIGSLTSTPTAQNMIATLLSKLLNPISVSVKECIDRFAKNLENITEEAFIAFDKEFKETKIELIVRAAHLLRGYSF